ncbi:MULTISPECIES: RNA polymerase sigma factor [Bacteroidota]|uniref:RNA polymerase sigma factor n=2 Tax=Bacteroidota TaxID=976 RepID=A0A2X2JMM9_SPHMU|nr:MULTISPECIES: sigma-70 family RNA polymerase sigma factor [Bacteroidota]AZB25145.1 sigma-70 family RNA polymerase sigma factor [Chryseobacterium bernardetii]QRQ63234.1 sigma-70 family RNA polymerase sigma factor [Sphingobacterium multivorum]SPZ95074.1 RNA polymerase sigma factor [Sphingobacterium multivorum]
MSLFSRNKNSYDIMFQKIYETYRKRVFDIAIAKVKDRDDALDIMQNVFFHVWKYKASLTSANTESIIIKTCNQEISNFASRKKKQPFLLEISDLQLQDDSSDALETQLEKEEMLNAVHLSIELLPTARKQIFKLNKLDGIKQEKIADHLHLSTKAVENQVYKAMSFLRNYHKKS